MKILIYLWTFPNYCGIVCATNEGGSANGTEEKAIKHRKN